MSFHRNHHDHQTPEAEERILRLAMTELSRVANRALLVIALFEILMVVNWWFSFDHDLTLGSLGYLVCYLVLLAASLITIVIITRERKMGLPHPLIVKRTQDIYAVLILLWALAITLLDGLTRGSYNVIVFVTIITIVPVFCYMRPLVWAIIEGLLGLAIIIFAIKYFDMRGLKGFLINFSVFIIMSIVAEMSFLEFRRKYYRKEYLLRLKTEEEHRAAREDYLTGLPNQRSYAEAVLAFENELPGDLVVASFDLNSLKTLNDERGHRAGDEAIRLAGQALKESFAGIGIVYRVGGDEFTGLLRASREAVVEADRRLHEFCRDHSGTYCGKITISAGYSCAADYPGALLQVLENDADHEMYRQKKAHHETAGK
ncbi:MAG: GGDEF domain-containing protein [Lachnospiraceae bacterium]|nr:GGDEF domain-containing protein [Lachnospiraceae bacterium]